MNKLSKVISLLVLTMTLFHANAASYSTVSDGQWGNSANWSGGNAPSLPLNNNDIITISAGDSIFLSVLFDVKNTSTLNINDGAVLIMDAGIDAKNSLTINVSTTGKLIINSDVSADNGASININGEAELNGDLELKGLGTIDIEGSLNIDGNVVGINNNNNFVGSGELTVTGSVTNVSLANFTGIYNGVSLPIELISFEVTEISTNKISASWSTASELNNDFFTIEYSVDYKSWSSLGEFGGAGTTSEYQEYQEIINKPLGIYTQLYFRLKQTDFDGKYTYSHIQNIKIKSSEENQSVYPTISNSSFNITTAENIRSISLMSCNNKTVKTYTNIYSQNYSLNIENYPHGYYLLVINTTHQTTVEPVIIY